MVPQPDWWPTLAYYTDWFDWQAIGAIGTMAAVIGLAWQTFRGERERRRVEAAGLVRVVMALYGLSRFIETIVDVAEDRAQHLSGFALRVPAMTFHLRELDGALETPQTDTLAWYDALSARTRVEECLDIFKRVADDGHVTDRWPDLIENVDKIRRYALEIHRRARLLDAGPFRRALLHLGFAMEDRGWLKDKLFSHASPPRTAGPTDGTAAPSSREESA